jgi:hypothetical protein
MSNDDILKFIASCRDNEQIINVESDDTTFSLGPGDYPSDDAPSGSVGRNTSTSRKKQAAEDDCYPVGIGRKFLLIFNYLEIIGEKERTGSERDVENLKRTFEDKDFEVYAYEDLTKESTVKVLEKYRVSPEMRDTSVLFMVFMSHGDGEDQESFLSSDAQSISMEKDVRLRFNDHNCPLLAGKPKVMVGNCCRDKRGTENLRTSPEQKSASTPEDSAMQSENQNIGKAFYPNNRLAVDGKMPPFLSNCDEKDFNDIMTIYSCVRGKISYRDKINGSLFVQAFCKVITESAHKYDMYRIFTETQREMRLKRPECNSSLEGYEPCMEPPLTFGTLFLV